MKKEHGCMCIEQVYANFSQLSTKVILTRVDGSVLIMESRHWCEDYKLCLGNSVYFLFEGELLDFMLKGKSSYY